MSATIVRFGVNPPAIETGKPNDVLSGTPVTKVQNYFADTSGQFFAGIWESSIGKYLRSALADVAHMIPFRQLVRVFRTMPNEDA